MARLIYLMNTSLDGYIEDDNGDFGWSTPGDEEFSFFIRVVSSTGTYLYGRRLYETMVYWETAHDLPDQPQSGLEFAKRWQEAEKIVYSTTLAKPRSARTRIERVFDPVAVSRLKADADRDILRGGPELASQALKAGLVDEVQMMVCPVVVGRGKRFFPDGLWLDLKLIEERRFPKGAVFVRYACGLRR